MHDDIHYLLSGLQKIKLCIKVPSNVNVTSLFSAPHDSAHSLATTILKRVVNKDYYLV